MSIPENQRDALNRARGLIPLASGDRLNTSARATQLLASLAASWKERATREPAALNAALASTLTSLLGMSQRITDQALMAHTSTVIEACEASAEEAERSTAAEQQQQQQQQPPLSASTGNPASTASASTAAESTAAPPASSTRPFRPTLHVQVLFMRLLLLQVQRLPQLFRTAWDKSAAAGEPLPPGLDVDAFLGFFTWARAACRRVIDAHVRSRGSSWNGGISALVGRAFHIEVLSLFHAPDPAPDESTVEAEGRSASSSSSPLHPFFTRLETLLLPRPDFVDTLLRYVELKDLLIHLSALINHEGHTLQRRGQITMIMLRCWRTRTHPPRPSTMSPAKEGANVHSHAQDPSLLVRVAPPLLGQHESLLTFVSLQVDALWREEHARVLRAAAAAAAAALNERHGDNGDEARQQHDHPLTYRFLREVVAECALQFDASIAVAAGAGGAPERCLLPVFALVGAMTALHDQEGPGAVGGARGEQQGASRARQELQRMVAWVVHTPDIQGVVAGAGDARAQAQAPPGGQAHRWPCTNTQQATCASCLFVWIASAAVVHAARFLTSAETNAAPHTEPASASTSTVGVANSAILPAATWLLMRTFLQLIDCTWVLQGTIQVRTREAELTSSTPPPTPAANASLSDHPEHQSGGAEVPILPAAAPSLSRSAATTPPVPLTGSANNNNSSKRSRSLRLISWTRSPFYTLLPHHSRALASLFLASIEQGRGGRGEQVALLTHMWQRVKYIHGVWRWYGQFVAAASNASKGDNATNVAPPAAASPTASSSAQSRANQRLQNIAKMQPTNNPVTIPLGDSPAASASSSSSSAPPPSPPHLFLDTSTPLNPLLLSRTHSTLQMSVTMFLATIMKHPSWCRVSTGHTTTTTSASLPSAADDDDDDAQSLHSFGLACLLDLVSLLEFGRSTDEFGPYKDLMSKTLAIVSGKEVFVATTDNSNNSGGGGNDESLATSTPSTASSTEHPPPPPAPPRGSWLIQASRAHAASIHRASFARMVLRHYFRAFFRFPLNNDDDDDAAAAGRSSSSSSSSMVDDPRMNSRYRWMGMEQPDCLEALGRTSSLFASSPPSSGAAASTMSFASLVAQSGHSFAPRLLESLPLPDPRARRGTCCWPPLCRELLIRPPDYFDGGGGRRSTDTVYCTRLFFLLGLWTGVVGAGAAGSENDEQAELLDWTLAFNYLLPFSWSLIQFPQVDVNARVQGLLGKVIAKGYKRATTTTTSTVTTSPAPEDTGSAGDPLLLPPLPLPAPISGVALESYIRSLVPFWLKTLLSLYPRVVRSPALIDPFLTVFSTLPSTDLLLLSLLSSLLDRSALLLNELMGNEQALSRWRQVVELEAASSSSSSSSSSAAAALVAATEEGSSAAQRDDQEEAEEAAEAEAESLAKRTGAAWSSSSSAAPSWFQRVPPNVRLPRHFPRDSFAATRSLLLLYLQLMQQLDGSLFPRALALLEVLLELTLDPRLHAVATPLRASVASLIHQTLVRSFDLYKRDEAVAWFLAIVRRLSIPVGIKEPPTPPPQRASSTRTADSNSKLSKEEEKRLKEITRLRKHKPTAAASSANFATAATRRV